jgi:hypothetical protein
VIIDTHVHVISGDQRRYPRRADTLEWITDTSGETLLSLIVRRASTRRCWCKATERMSTITVYAADCARTYPDRFACVIIVDQRQHDAPERLNYWVKERGARAAPGYDYGTGASSRRPADVSSLAEGSFPRDSDFHHDTISSGWAPACCAGTLPHCSGSARSPGSAATKRWAAVYRPNNSVLLIPLRALYLSVQSG